MSRLALMEQIARDAGELLVGFFRQRNLSSWLKPDQSVVTQADLASDRLISDALRREFPQSGILSEEIQPELLSSAGESSDTWVIDPLDGTSNFSLGLPVWGVLITHLVQGWPIETVNYFPVMGELYAARRGQGATLNGVPIHIEPPHKDRPYSFFSCCSRTHQSYQVSVPYKTRIFGSAAYTFCCLARGAALIGFEATAKIWDIAGAWLLVSEAEGAIETLDGSQPFPTLAGVDYAQQRFPTLAAATSGLLVRSHGQIQPRV